MSQLPGMTRIGVVVAVDVVVVVVRNEKELLVVVPRRIDVDEAMATRLEMRGSDEDCGGAVELGIEQPRSLSRTMLATETTKRMPSENERQLLRRLVFQWSEQRLSRHDEAALGRAGTKHLEEWRTR